MNFSAPFLLITLFSLIVTSSLPAFGATDLSSAQTATTDGFQRHEAPVDFNRAYIKGYGTDFAHILTSPARWDASDWITAALVAGTSAALYGGDAKIREWVLDHRTTTTDDIGDTVTDLGHGKYTPALLGGMYLYGYLADDGKMRKTVLLSVESFVLTGVLVQALKYGAHRHRPDTNDGPRAWDGPGLRGGTATFSFPSGHASSAFAVASVIASEYENRLVPSLAYGVAAITALNRVAHDGHWSSDIFVGSAIGYFTGKAIVASHRTAKETALRFIPMIDGGNIGMMAATAF